MAKFRKSRLNSDVTENKGIFIILLCMVDQESLAFLTCFSVEQISSDPSQAQVDQLGHLRLRQ